MLLKMVSIYACFIFSSSAIAEGQPVDLQLVLAVDTSSSVVPAEYELQTKGILSALEDPQTQDLLEKCNSAGMAVTYVEWAGNNHRRVAAQLVGWQHVHNGKDLKELSKKIRDVTIREMDGDTDIMTALHLSSELLRDSPFTSPRKIVNLSSDGIQNVSSFERYHGNFGDNLDLAAELGLVRDELTSSGIVVDALVIQRKPEDDRISSLPEYFEKYVKGGSASFVYPVRSYEDYAESFKALLHEELNNCMM